MQSQPQFPTYKVHLLGPHNVIQHTYLFTSSAADGALADAPTGNITAIDIPIYPDDTIMTVKLKMLKGLSPYIPGLSVEAMWVFCHKYIAVSLGDMYNTFTNNGKIKLPVPLLTTFMNNIVLPADAADAATAAPLNIAEFIELANPDNTPDIQVVHALGQPTWIQPAKLVAFNPFLASSDDLKIWGRLSDQSFLATNNNALLMDTGDIVDNAIYLCTADDVLAAGATDDTNVIIKIYYPHLWEAGIRTVADLRQHQNTLNTAAKVFENSPNASRLAQYFNTIDMFYGVYIEQTATIAYLQRGIKNIHICIRPAHKYNISLEILFKILHATQEYPLVKYNPSMRQENIYRLFTNKISTDGLKIPFLKKNTVMRLIKDVGNQPKTVALYCEHPTHATVTCEIDERGQFFIKVDSAASSGGNATAAAPHYFSSAEIDTIIADTVNPIISNIQEYFSQNGYNLPTFSTIFAQNVDVLNMAYSFLTPFTTLDLGKIKTCVTAVFNNETSIFKSTQEWKLHLRFKRVSHFNKLTSQQAFVMDKIKDGYATADIAALLAENFKDDMTHTEALNLIHTIVNEQQLRKKSGRQTLAVTDNPGFPVEFEYATPQDNIVIHVNGINNVAYLNTIPVYIDTLLRLATAKGGRYSTNYTAIQCEMRASKKKGRVSVATADTDDYSMPSLIHAAVAAAADVAPQQLPEDTDAPEDDTAMYDEEEQRKMQELIAMYGNMDDEDADEDDLTTEGGAHAGAPTAKTVRIADPRQSDDSDNDSDSDDDIKNMQNLDKIKIKRFFQNRIKKRDPQLFTTGMGKNYSRECQANSKRQPIALTADELAEVKAQYPNFLRPEDIITYGSDEKHQINYVCPRFWCLKTNMPIDPAEMTEVVGADGKRELVHPTCGKILPDKAKGIIPGHYIYEFYGANDTQYPGLIPGKNKGDTCLPCCFAKWNTRGRMDALKKCNTGTATAAASAAAATATTAHDISTQANGLEKTDNVDYIKGPDKVPLPLGRWGHLPMQLQFFFKEMNIDCQISKLIPIVKQDHPCIMRHGVEHTNPPQSFIACMSNILYYGTGVNIKTIRELKAHIIASMTLDTFITYQNGNLITNFYDGAARTKGLAPAGGATESIFPHDGAARTKGLAPAGGATESIFPHDGAARTKGLAPAGGATESIFPHDGAAKGAATEAADGAAKGAATRPDIAPYKNTRIYNALMKNPDEIAASAQLYKIVAAYENFTRYLTNDDVRIDHTYLWDIFALPNRAIFPRGVNLVIFEILNNDITNNINILCPSNYYSTAAYDPDKPTVFIVKQYDYYEPIYSYTKLKEGKIQINKIFMEKDPNIHPTIRLIIQKIVRPFVNTICRPLNSMPTVYHIKTAPVANVLVAGLKKCQYTAVGAVLNFDSKVIAIMARADMGADAVYVPCYPSTYTATPPLPFVLMTDTDLWTTYAATVDFLTTLATTAKHHKVDIPCRPMLQVMEDRLIVGILTETNQFIQIAHPTNPADAHPPLPRFKRGSNTQAAEAAIATAAVEGGIDTERKDYIDRIKKETAFYTVFRNTLKILINNYTNDALNIKTQIIHTCTATLELYGAKLKRVRDLLRVLGRGRIRFVGDDKYYKLVDNFTTCINAGGDADAPACGRGVPATPCALSGGNCDIILPAKNLTTGKPNDDVYYTRFADELIRYAHIRNYIMEPYNLYSFGAKIGYDLNDDEILLIQSLITAEYFDSLIPAEVNHYVKTMAYDQVNPVTHQDYDNTVNYGAAIAAPLADGAKQAADAVALGATKKCAIDAPRPVEAWGKCVVSGERPCARPEGCGAKNQPASEIKYTCGLQLINYLIQATTGITLSATDIKKQLAAIYDRVPANKGIPLITTALCEHMETDLIKPAATAPVGDTYTILVDTYKLNLVDLWLLTDKYRIPAIFIDDEGHSAVSYTHDDNTAFCLVFAGGKNMTEFKLILKNDNPDPRIEVGDCFETARLAYVSVETLIDVKMGIMRAPKPRGRPRKVIKLSDSEEPVATTQPEPTLVDSDIIQIAAPLRKRGRPRKIIQLSASE